MLVIKTPMATRVIYHHRFVVVWWDPCHLQRHPTSPTQAPRDGLARELPEAEIALQITYLANKLERLQALSQDLINAIIPSSRNAPPRFETPLNQPVFSGTEWFLR
jgi:hypothetical protein